MNVIDLDKLENLKSDGDGWIAACPLCRHEGRDKTGVHLKIYPTGAFGCVVAQKDKEHNAGILQLVGTEATGVLTHYTSSPQEPKIKVPSSWPLSILDKLIFDYSYFESRGISAETQKYFRMGFANSGQLNGRMVIPIFSPQKDKIIGFTGRMVNYTKWHKENKIPKWKHLNPANQFVFTGDEKEIAKFRKILITEGPADVLSLYECGIKNTLCLFGTTISSKQLGFLIGANPEKIIIGLNNEIGSSNGGVGNRAAIDLQKKLMNFFSSERIVIGLPTHKDFNEDLMKDKKLIEDYKSQWLS